MLFIDIFFMWALLSDFGIKTWNHYSPMHLSSSFRSRLQGKGGDCPVAEAKFEQYVSLPIHPRLTEEAVAYMIDAIKQLSQRPHIPRLSPAPLLNALMSLYVDNVSAHTPDLPTDKDWEGFKSEVQTSALFSHSASITTTRAPGRLDLMGMVCCTLDHHLIIICSIFSPHPFAQAETTITLEAWCSSAQYQRQHLSLPKHA
jgi:hypothetical protein